MSKKMGKEKGTFIEVCKLLAGSCRSKQVKIQSSKSKFEVCSASRVFVGKREFVFWV